MFYGALGISCVKKYMCLRWAQFVSTKPFPKDHVPYENLDYQERSYLYAALLWAKSSWPNVGMLEEPIASCKTPELPCKYEI